MPSRTRPQESHTPQVDLKFSIPAGKDNLRRRVHHLPVKRRLHGDVPKCVPMDCVPGPRTGCFQYPQAHRSEEHTSELQSLRHLVCRLLLEKKKKKKNATTNDNTRITQLPLLLHPRCRAANPTTVRSVCYQSGYVTFHEVLFFFFLKKGRPPKFSLFPHPAPFQS